MLLGSRGLTRCGFGGALRVAALMVSVVWLTGCEDQMAAHKTGRLLEKMHEQMNGQDWGGIYQGADPGFREGTGKADFTKLFSDVHRKLGDAGAGYLRDTQIDSTFQGKFVTTWVDTDFTNDPEVHERIVWHAVNGTYKLYRYDVDSKLLTGG
jgi:hypothetical protein